MPLYELKLTQQYFNQECLNTFYYHTVSTTASISLSLALGIAFGAIPDNSIYPTGTPFDAIRKIQSVGVQHHLLTVRNLYSATDFFETGYSPDAPGFLTGSDGMSPTQASGFFTNRTRNDIRRGTKRIVGVTEANAGGGGVFQGGGLTDLADVAAEMSRTLEYNDSGNTLSWNPVVLGRVLYWPSGEEGVGKPAYRFYDTQAEQEENMMTSIVWDFYPTVRTQTSRQYGRGR